MKIQLKRSNALDGLQAKEPTAGQMEYGELAVNYNVDDPAIFIKDSKENIIRIGGVGNIADDGQTEIPAGPNPPLNPQPGNFWYNSEDGRLYYYYEDTGSQGRGASSQWVDASPDSQSNPVESGETFPATALPDDLFFNTTDGRLYIYYKDGDSEQWVDASPDIQPQTNDLWKRDGTTVLPKTIGDSVEIGGTAEGNGKITLNAADGSGSFENTIKAKEGCTVGTNTLGLDITLENSRKDVVYHAKTSSTDTRHLWRLNNIDRASIDYNGDMAIGITGSFTPSTPAISLNADGSAKFSSNLIQLKQGTGSNGYGHGVINVLAGGTNNTNPCIVAFDGSGNRFTVEGDGTTKIGGVLPSAPNISLNADGTTSFTDGFVYTPTANGGGYSDLYRSTGGGNDVSIFRMYRDEPSSWSGPPNDNNKIQTARWFTNGTLFLGNNETNGGLSSGSYTNIILNATAGSITAVGDIQSTSQNGGPLGGFRNFITNGDMAIDQRYNGTLTTVKSTNEYILDHWRGLGGNNGGSNSAELGQVTTTFPQRNVFRHSMQISHVNGASYTGSVGCVQGIEEQFAAGQTLTVSCYATEAPANLEFFLSSNTLTGRVVQYSGTMTDLSGVDDANGFRYYSATFELISTNSIGNIGGVEFKWTGGAARYMTGVQVERSPVATPFEHRPIQTELALCQRYYYQLPTFSGGSYFAVGAFTSNSLRVGLASITPVTFRTTPTITATDIDLYGDDNVTAYPATSAVMHNEGILKFSGAISTSTNTNNKLYSIRGNAGSFLSFDAEL